MILPVRRNGDLGKITGIIKDEEGKPVPGVEVSIPICCSAFTDGDGEFLLAIPFSQQKERQRLSVLKEGFKPQDVSTPVIPGELVRLILEKQ